MRVSRATLPFLTFSNTVLGASLPSYYRASLVVQLTQCVAFYSSTATSANQTFTYRLAASYSGKNNYYKPRIHTYTHTPSTYSHTHFDHKVPARRANSGQDSFFIASVNKSESVAFGVADGVGGWDGTGITSAALAHGLCHYMSSRAEASAPNSTTDLCPQKLLQGAYDDVSQDPSITAGGTTACVAVAREDGDVAVANLGDSGFAHLRSGKVVYASPSQLHAFNTPYQLSVIPPQMQAQVDTFGGEVAHDMPKDANLTNHAMEHGDVLVFASDGVWDNIPVGDVLTIIGKYMTKYRAWPMNATETEEAQETLVVEDSDATLGNLDELTQDGGVSTSHRTLQAALAVAIAGEAKIASLDEKREVPFGRELHRNFPDEEWHGGKPDDITVVVAVVVGSENGGSK